LKDPTDRVVDPGAICGYKQVCLVFSRNCFDLQEVPVSTEKRLPAESIFLTGHSALIPVEKEAGIISGVNFCPEDLLLQLRYHIDWLLFRGLRFVGKQDTKRRVRDLIFD